MQLKSGGFLSAGLRQYPPVSLVKHRLSVAGITPVTCDFCVHVCVRDAGLRLLQLHYLDSRLPLNDEGGFQ